MYSSHSLDPRYVDQISADGGNATGDQIGPNTFKIRDTNTTLVLYRGQIVTPRAAKNLFNATVKFIEDQILASGDGQLPQYIDPFTYDLEQGAFIQVNSSEGQHLTYVLLDRQVSLW